MARVDWPRERLDRHRTERLRALLAYARERSPFHAARLSALDPSTATVADLARLPPMLKGEAQDEWDAIVTVPHLDRAGAERILADAALVLVHVLWRAGVQLRRFERSTRRVRVGLGAVRDARLPGLADAGAGAAQHPHVRPGEQRSTSDAPGHPRLAVLCAGEPPHASTPLFDIPITADTETVVIGAGAPFDEVLAAVAQARPTQLVGYASVIGRLAHAALAGELDIRPSRVSTNSEPLNEDDREAITRAWNAPIHNLWGSTEIGVQAVGCGHSDGLHVCEDEVVLERVDESGTPVADDQPAARTLATGLAGQAFPFIRYDLGDEVTLLPGQCPCGSSLVRVAAIAGRRDDDFTYGQQSVPASAFRYVLGTDPRISEYQVRQTSSGAQVLVVGSPDVTAVTAALTAALRKHGLTEPEIGVEPVARIERNAASGKLRRFVALPGRNEAGRSA